jgi:hypothetical protein
LKLGVPEAGKRIKTDEESKDSERNTILNEEWGEGINQKIIKDRCSH